MVEIPPYMRLVVSHQVRRSESSAKVARQVRSGPGKSVKSQAPLDDNVEVTSRVTSQNRMAMSPDVPTALEAEEALRALQENLPNMGPEVEDVHSGLDRRVILSLLAPLVN